MASDQQSVAPPLKQLPLHRSGKKLSFERRLRLWFYLIGLPGLLLSWSLLSAYSVDRAIAIILLVLYAFVWMFLVSVMLEQITRPLQTLANVVAALREDDYSFRARGAKRNDAIGDLALEINALANLLQTQRAGALEAIALVERVVDSMHSPVMAFDLAGRLKLLNAAAERTFSLKASVALGRTAKELGLERLSEASDDDLLPLENGQASRWMIKRAGFRLRGIPHTLLVLADVSTALREEERMAWKRLIRVLGHEINNSLTPIKSIAESLRVQLERTVAEEQREDFVRGLEVIEDRSESLNRFLQAYRQLMGLPAPKTAPVVVKELIERVAKLETRLRVEVKEGQGITMLADGDQLQQALINLVRNATEAARGPEEEHAQQACVEIEWFTTENDVVIVIADNGPGLTNQSNLFVPFYTTKPNGTGIGLVLAQQIAEAHGGMLRLYNRTDKSTGCIAELRLPRAMDGASLNQPRKLFESSVPR
ncbi:MAG: ATP-binding protein [Edaphobacter sp.]|uniref:sensor histidine kinase n=1 Tax=Edaphobacter sp. TaxID=1934404 RepID=UPI0023A38874|nr:ATP-binding protein [Edaphobacter sp.]MDE1175809.1 ATP-binding protein [Edaphobacter sp.]